MRLLIKLDYNKTFITRDVTVDEMAKFVDIISGGIFVTEKYDNTSGEYKTVVDGERELEIVVLQKHSKRIPELPLRQHVLETVIKEAADEALPNG